MVIIASATTSLVTVLMGNSVQDQTMENVFVESVHAIQNGMFQVTKVDEIKVAIFD